MELRIYNPEGTPFQSLTLTEGRAVVFGREATCDVVLASSSISRQHARFLVTNGTLLLEDLRSSHGTRVNGDLLRGGTSGPRALKESDEVVIGGFVVRINAQTQNTDSAGRRTPPSCPSAVPVSPSPSARGTNLSSEASPTDRVLAEIKELEALYTEEVMRIKPRIHEFVLAKLNLSGGAKKEISEDRSKVEEALDRVLLELAHELPMDIDFKMFREAMLDEFVEYGPISPLLREKEISEVMVNGPDRVFIEMRGRLYETGVRFFNPQQLDLVVQRIVEPLGRHVDTASPMVDARLKDGSRVNVIIPPLALDGASVTIRKFPDKKLTKTDLVKFGSMTDNMALFLEEAVRSRQNILISGGTGSGKTSLLNVLSLFIPQSERVVTVEDSAELKLTHRNLIRLEARPANIEGSGKISIRDLVVNTLRMRPDRIIVGECRGAEALDMLQAMNTGHDGSMTTCHANTPRDALARLETMVMMAGFDLPSRAIREQIAAAVNIVVQQTRLLDGSRKIVEITEVTGREGETILLQPIFVFDQEKIEHGQVVGKHKPTGNVPEFIAKLREAGNLRLSDSVFVPTE
jgi:pilus assembly protein CpaF